LQSSLEISMSIWSTDWKAQPCKVKKMAARSKCFIVKYAVSYGVVIV
jgi:hypothetical protein